eukprot:scaffold2188_cov182-Ochromonas_danica.AAC.8
MFRRLIYRSLPSCSLQQVRSKVTFSAAHAQDGPKEYLQFLADKKKSGQFLANRDLRHIILKAKEAKDFQTAYNAVVLYQAIENQRAKLAVNFFKKPDVRLGAWLSRKPFNALLENLLEGKDYASVANLLNVVKAKGISYIVEEKTLADLAAIVEQAEDKEAVATLQEALQKK